jgi:hypothetical protein
LIIGSAGPTDLRPHSSALSIATSDAARVTGERVGLNCTIRSARGAQSAEFLGREDIWMCQICTDERCLHVLQRQDRVACRQADVFC